MMLYPRDAHSASRREELEAAPRCEFRGMGIVHQIAY
jgi:hypothetical protein